MKAERHATHQPSEPTELNPHEASFFAAELGGDIPELDLHGLSVEEALCKLETFVYRKHPRGTEALKIIHGRGRQKLHAAVQDWLKNHKDCIAYYRDSHDPSQQGAVTYAALY